MQKKKKEDGSQLSLSICGRWILGAPRMPKSEDAHVLYTKWHGIYIFPTHILP